MTVRCDTCGNRATITDAEEKMNRALMGKLKVEVRTWANEREFTSHDSVMGKVCEIAIVFPETGAGSKLSKQEIKTLVDDIRYELGGLLA